MTDLAVLVNGARYAGWKQASVTRSIENLCGTFAVTVSDTADIAGIQAIRPGDPVTVELAGKAVISGYVDGVAPSYDSENHQVTMTGRDATADLVDCSADQSPGEWHSLNLEGIAAALCRPFGLQVVALVDTGKAFRRFRIEEGETVHEALERAARHRGVIAHSDGARTVLLTRAGESKATIRLKRGVNILAAEATYDHRDRFSDYTVKGQQPGFEDLPPDLIANTKATARDTGIRRHRPLVVISEDVVDEADARSRVQWEANVRAARARRLSVGVQGWRERGDEGSLWTPNRLIHVEDAWLDVDQDMLIAGVEYRLDDQGSRTTLTLYPPDAFKLLAVDEQKDAFAWLS